MTNQEIFELMSRFEGSSLHKLKLTNGSFSLELSKDAQSLPSAPAVPLQPSAMPAPVSEGESVIAPLAGIYYAASAPDAAPFVTAGSRVSKGETLCLMEAMKMLSEVPAPCDCVITEVCKENGTLAAFGEPLFRYRPC